MRTWRRRSTRQSFHRDDIPYQKQYGRKAQKGLSNLFRQLVQTPIANIQALSSLLPFEFPFGCQFYIHFTDEFAPITQHEILALLYENHLPKQFECEMIPLSRRHAGISGEWTNERIQAYASEIEKILVQNMSYPEINHVCGGGKPVMIYGSCAPICWRQENGGPDLFQPGAGIVSPPERSLSTWPKEEQQKILKMLGTVGGYAGSACLPPGAFERRFRRRSSLSY